MKIISNSVNKAFVSVVITTFERDFTLKRAITSVLNQTFKEFEILVVNDSPNETKTMELISGFDDKRIKYLRNRRTKGGNGARNTGILNSKYDFIAFLDDDDEWLENKLSDQYNFLKNSSNDVGGVWSGFLRLEKMKWKNYNNYTFPYDDSLIKGVVTQNISLGAGSNLMIKREVVDLAGLFDESLKRHQDLEYIIRILRNFKLLYLNKIHLKVYPSGRENPSLLERAFVPYINKIKPELDNFTRSEKKIFFAHKYFTLAKLFSDEGRILKTTKYCVKTISSKLMNPFTLISFILKSIKLKIKSI